MSNDDIPRQIKREASKAGKTEREYCLSRIEYWKEMLQKASEDYRALSEAKFQQLVDEELFERDSQ